MLSTRIVSALILVPIVALLVWQGGLLFAILIALAGALGIWEFYRLMRVGGYRPHPAVGLVAFALMVLAATGWSPLPQLDRFAVALLLFGGLLWALAAPDEESTLPGWAVTVGGALYVGWPMAHAISLRALPGTVSPTGLPALPTGLAWVLVVLVATWACDTGAYFAGRFFGRRPFSPRWSPSKTWEGTLGGWFLCLLVAMLLARWLLGLPLLSGALLGALLGPAAVYGDLAESMIKRRVGVKDSGDLIPGHGGLLDRADSLLFTTLIGYYCALWLM